MERFWAKVDKDGPIPAHAPELGPCWIWTAYKSKKGYGYFKPFLSHRVSYVAATQCETDDLVLHKCDNRACVRPTHLFSGTHTDNMRDMAAKGRWHDNTKTRKRSVVPRARGEAASCVKLTEADVREIRALRQQGVSGRSLAMRFGVIAQNISNIVTGKTWRHVA